MKKAIKKTVKVKRPKYTIDMRDVEDVTIDFICQKVENGMELTGSDFATFTSIIPSRGNKSPTLVRILKEAW
jgi:hypothetical protein